MGERSAIATDSKTGSYSVNKAGPVSIFVSRKSNTLSVRKGFKPLFEAPVTIRDPESRGNARIYADAVARSGRCVVSLDRHVGSRGFASTAPSLASSLGSRLHHTDQISRKHIVETAAPQPSAEKANAALDRIEMPPDAAERIAELLIPGSSLIVSDHGISSETGSDTDFIVETR